MLLNEGIQEKVQPADATYSAENRFAVVKSRVIHRSYRQTNKSSKDDVDTE
jgi:hypothetical protein